MSIFNSCLRWLNLTSRESLPSTRSELENTDSEKCHNRDGNYREVCLSGDGDTDNVVLRFKNATENSNHDVNDDVYNTMNSMRNKNNINETKNDMMKMNRNNNDSGSDGVIKTDGIQNEKECNSPFFDLILNTRNTISSKIQQGRIRAVETISNIYVSEKSNRSSSNSKNSKSGDKINDIVEKQYKSCQKPRSPECVICLVEFSEGNTKN